MPPEDEDRLTDDEVHAIELWIAGGARFNAASQRVAAEGVKPDYSRNCTLVGLDRQTVVIHHGQLAVMLIYHTLFGKIQRYDGDVFHVDILPDIEFGPVGQGESSNTLALRYP